MKIGFFCFLVYWLSLVYWLMYRLLVKCQYTSFFIFFLLYSYTYLLNIVVVYWCTRESKGLVYSENEQSEVNSTLCVSGDMPTEYPRYTRTPVHHKIRNICVFPRRAGDF